MNLETEEEEKESLITSGAKVVEHLEPIMSRELLCKFPDNSTFGFDYSQSSIWSPLVPRSYSPMELDLITPRKLSYEFGLFGFELEKNSKNNISAKKKKKKKKTMTTASLNVSLNLFKKKKVSEFSPANVKGSCAPLAAKGWSKLLKAACRHFKKKKDVAGHLKLSNCLRNASN